MTIRIGTLKPLKFKHGLTLLEVMVALGIGAFMLAGILSLVASVSRARTDLDVTSEQIENGRYALQVFADELVLAGFLGQSRMGDVTYSSPQPCAGVNPISGLGFNGTSPVVVPLPLRGYVADTAAIASFLSCASDVVVDSEVLVTHRVETSPVAQADAVNGRPYLQVSACDIDPTTTPFVFSSVTADFVLRQRTCGTNLAPLWPYTVKIFYLAGCDVCSGGGDGIPTLKMAELVGNAIQITPLVEGVTDMHFEYGLDFDGDGGPDCYADDVNSDTPATGCPAVGANGWQTNDIDNWADVVSIRVNLLVRSADTISGWTDDHKYELGEGLVGPFGDGYRRQVYGTTVVLPNVAGVRE